MAVSGNLISQHPWLRNNVLDLSACFPTSAPRSPTHSFAGNYWAKL